MNVIMNECTVAGTESKPKNTFRFLSLVRVTALSYFKVLDWLRVKAKMVQLVDVATLSSKPVALCPNPLCPIFFRIFSPPQLGWSFRNLVNHFPYYRHCACEISVELKTNQLYNILLFVLLYFLIMCFIHVAHNGDYSNVGAKCGKLGWQHLHRPALELNGISVWKKITCRKWMKYLIECSSSHAHSCMGNNPLSVISQVRTDFSYDHLTPQLFRKRTNC